MKQRFNPAAVGDLDATVEFNWGDGACRVSIHDGQAAFHEQLEHAPPAELIIYFRDLEQARELITGQGNPIEAFMAGEFRSNGYLVWVFQTLAAFSRT